MFFINSKNQLNNDPFLHESTNSRAMRSLLLSCLLMMAVLTVGEGEQQDWWLDIGRLYPGCRLQIRVNAKGQLTAFLHEVRFDAALCSYRSKP